MLQWARSSFSLSIRSLAYGTFLCSDELLKEYCMCVYSA